MKNRPTETCDACKGDGHLGMVDGSPQICDYCAGEGVVPKLTPTERAELVAKAEKATAALAGAGKLEGPQLGRFVELLNAESGGTFKLPLPKTVPLPVQVRPATDEEQRTALSKVAFSLRFKPFNVPAEVIDTPEDRERFSERLLREAFEHAFDPVRDLISETITVDGKLKPRPQGFPVRRVDVCKHGAGRGAICEKCTESAAVVPNRALLILRMLDIAADLVEQAHRDGLPGAPVLDADFATGKGRHVAATFELLERVLNARDMARGWATDRQVCFADFGPCACEKCSPTE